MSTAASNQFAGQLPNEGAIAIDIALPFEWTWTPAHCGVFGSSITRLVKNESPASLDTSVRDSEEFFCYTWVDGHILFEEDLGNRLELCEASSPSRVKVILKHQSATRTQLCKQLGSLHHVGSYSLGKTTVPTYCSSPSTWFSLGNCCSVRSCYS
ncbi:LOW QUALITY PROTEIN: hypothetical protein PHMEG_0004938 [Phytophthora megakarya]|uniref:Uncharacterized protein n=1 Tax=Phytophthora megakarya TaxID=4795 RepID=A0A225WSH7_9STRA|nr:LOW QUALITY PROTEIN: hypothetical protein PHMEG_0004938 [Phytophthora megakarya]